MITEVELHNLYPKDNYYAYSAVQPAKAKSGNGFIQRIKSLIIDTSTKDPHFEDVSQKIVLDIGCGSGEKLIEFRSDGWKEVRGVEIDKHSSELGKVNGIDIFNGTLSAAEFPSDYFDYVRSNHSFEHIIANTEAVNEMFRICKPGAKLFIGVPNTKSLNFKLFKKYWYYLGIPFHPFGYNPKNLTLMIERSGFRVNSVHFNGNALGILGSLQILFNTIFGIRHSKGLLLNKFLEIPFFQLARLLNLMRYGDCMEIIATKPLT